MLCRRVLADALPPLFRSVRRILCRLCRSSPADASLLWSYFFWWMLGHPLVVFVVSVGGLGDVLHVGSYVLGRLVGLGGLVRSSLLCSRRSASSVAVCFRWPFFSFSLLLVLCVLVPVNSCLASIKLCL